MQYLDVRDGLGSTGQVRIRDWHRKRGHCVMNAAGQRTVLNLLDLNAKQSLEPAYYAQGLCQ